MGRSEAFLNTSVEQGLAGILPVVSAAVSKVFDLVGARGLWHEHVRWFLAGSAATRALRFNILHPEGSCRFAEFPE